MLSAEWIQVETFNDTGNGSGAKISGRKFGFVSDAVAAATSNKVIDIGNSNYESAVKEMKQIDGFVDEIDFWVIPCKENAGMINDSISTVAELINDLAVDPSKIIMIPNEIERPEDGLDSFAAAMKAAKKAGFHFCQAPIVENARFDTFNADPRSIMEIAADDVDYTALIAAEEDPEKRADLASKKTLQGRARFLARNLRGVWDSTPMAALTASAIAA